MSCAKTYPLIFAILLTASVGKSQIEFGPEIMVGKSRITNSLKPLRDGETYTTEFRNSFSVGIFGQHALSTKTKLNAQLLFTQVNNFDGYYIDTDTADVLYPVSPKEGNPIRHWTYETSMQFNYLAIPISFQIQLYNRLNYSVGGQFSYLLGGEQIIYQYQRSSETKTLYKTRKLFHKKYDLSLISGLNYRIYKQLYIVGKFSGGIINIYDTLFSPNRESYSMQLLIGANYVFNKSNN